MEDELVHSARVTKADFRLLRVHIDIDARRIDVEEQAVGRVAAAVQQVLVGLAQRMPEQFVADEAAIDVAVLGVAAGAGVCRQRTVAGDAQRAGTDVEAARLGEKLVAEDGADAHAGIAGAEVQRDTAIVREGEGDAGMSQRNALDRLGAMRELAALRLEKFAAGRRVVVEIAHFDHRAGLQGRRLRARARLVSEPPGVLSGSPVAARLPAGQREACDGGDRGQRFATKTERPHAFEIGERVDLRGGMAGEGEHQFVTRHAAAVVADAQQLDPTFLELDLDRRAAGVERVLEQFLEDRRRTIDDFAGGDLADQKIREEGDSRCLGHGRIIPARLPVESLLAHDP